MRASTQPGSSTTTFSLERFAWDTPDRLYVSGWFRGLVADAVEPPVLVVDAGDARLSLPAVADRRSGPPQDGRHWSAAFAWDETPTAFDRVQLELGDLVVELPQPHRRRARQGERILEVRPAGVAARPNLSPAADRLALQTARLLVQEEISSLRSTVERLERDLERARVDVEAERGRRGADVERFRDGLAQVRAAADEAIAVERTAAADAAAKAEDARRRMTHQSARIAELERFADDAERRHAAIDAACAATEDLLGRLVSLRDASLTGNLS
jgi:hypothetical protein